MIFCIPVSVPVHGNWNNFHGWEGSRWPANGQRHCFNSGLLTEMRIEDGIKMNNRDKDGIKIFNRNKEDIKKLTEMRTTLN